jgi:hypothetical protein
VAHQPDTDTEVQRLLRPLSTKWVEAVCEVSRETVATWRSGASQPRPDRWDKLVAAVSAVLPDTQKNAPAEAGALLDEWFARWQKSESPDWAKDLTQDILNAIEGGRQAAVDAAIAAAVDVAERRLFGDTDPEDDSPPPDRPLGPGGSPSGRGTSGARPRS